MSIKKLKDEEFLGWNYMWTTEESGKWIYYSPDNLQAAMVEPSNGEVLFIRERKHGERLYVHPNIKKFINPMMYARRLNI